MGSGKPMIFLLRNGFVEKLSLVARGVVEGAAKRSHEGYPEFRILAEGLLSIFEEQHTIQLPS
jgi:hypothetical protein